MTASLSPWVRAQFVRSAKTTTQSERGTGRARNSRISGKYGNEVTLSSSESKSTASYSLEPGSTTTDGTIKDRPQWKQRILQQLGMFAIEKEWLADRRITLAGRE